ncbi:MAG TPA: phosphatase PAP2 family protein [Vicinamibacterales bacterium]|nr:phosphatase PAP2 family protein [Vicinamibacterales bacterium]
MFESEPILWVQGFASRWTSIAALALSAVETSTYLALALAVMFGVRFKAGVVLVHLIAWNAVLTNVLKDAFALPRPAWVDASVQSPGQGDPVVTPLRSDPDGFLSLPEERAIDYFRKLPDPEFGFPSGHVSAATVFWGELLLWLRSRKLALIGAAFVLVTALSRMYLGRHYLADVLGGFVLGTTLVLAHAAIRAWTRRTSASTRRRQAVNLAAAIAPMGLLTPGLSAPAGSLGALFAATVIRVCLAGRVLPLGEGGAAQRMLRVSIALGLFAASTYAIEGAVDAVGWNDRPVGRFTDEFVPLLVSVFVAAWLFDRFHLYPGPFDSPRATRLEES